MGLSISIKSPIYNFSCILNRRITIIKGDSGKGKTVLASFFEREEELPGIERKSDLPMIVLSGNGWDEVLLSVSNYIILIDDQRFVESARFADLLSKTQNQNNYFVIITRSDFDLKLFSRIPISINEIYEMKYDGANHWLEKCYKQKNINLSFDTACIIEDRGAGYSLFKAIREHNMYCATNGNSSIIDDVIDLLNAYNINKILVLFDAANFSCFADKFFDLLVIHGDVEVLWMINYECFEYLLLKSNMLKDLVSDEELSKEVNQYYSWEIYFENLLNNVTRNYHFHQTHSSKLNLCYYKPCNSIVKCTLQLKAKCIKYNSAEDKIKWLLEGTEFEIFLRLHCEDSYNSLKVLNFF